MANNVILDAADPERVGSAQVLSVLTAEPNVWLFIFTGIAGQEQLVEDDASFAHVEVILAKGISGILLQSATVVSLAQIHTEDDDDAFFVTDTWLELRDNGYLVLVAETDVIGDCAFTAFSYQANAKVMLDDASISGSIRWPKHSFAVPKAPPHFLISANSPLTNGGLTDQWQVEATGTENPLDDSDSTYYYIPYKIRGALLGKHLTVLVSVILKSFKITSPSTLVAKQISGPTDIHLTSTHRHQTDVNFEINQLPQPK